MTVNNRGKPRAQVSVLADKLGRGRRGEREVSMTALDQKEEMIFVIWVDVKNYHPKYFWQSGLNKRITDNMKRIQQEINSCAVDISLSSVYE